MQGEYDAVVFGKDTLIVVEIKHRLDGDDVSDFYNNSLPAFRKLFPEYADRKILGAVAGMTVEKATMKLANSKGLPVLTPSGQMSTTYSCIITFIMGNTCSLSMVNINTPGFNPFVSIAV